MNNRESIIERVITIPEGLDEVGEIQDVSIECNTVSVNKKRYEEYVSIILNCELDCLMEYISANKFKEIKYYNFKTYFSKDINIYEQNLFSRKINIDYIIEKVTYNKLENRKIQITVLICNIV